MSSSPRVSSVLVGRGPELDTLCELVGLGSSTGATAVLLAGDAGVGKTRLIGELQDRAVEAGWEVLVGHCVDFGGDALPYLPFSEVFGRLAGESPPLAQRLVQAHPPLARLMPGRRLVAADAGGDASSAVAGSGPAARSELFEAVHGALAQVTQTAPVLLVVEDVHWADASTRELLTFLFTRGSPAQISIVASYRTDDLHRRHPLRAEAAQWSRLRGVTRLHLAPLPEAAVRALVRELDDGGLPRAAVDRVVARAEGNPFFTEELVSAAQQGEQVLSAELADLVLLRLDQLDDTARTVLRAISVAGRRVSHTLLAGVVGPDGPDLDGALRSAIDHHLLVATQPEGYAFRHALLAEAVYDDLLPGERVRWHRAYADVLGSGAGEGTAAELARHARAAHDLPTALSASIRAGDEAMMVGGPAEATRHYEQALELLAEPLAGEAPAVDVVGLVMRASESAAAAGWLHRALALLQEQLAALPADAEPTLRAGLLVEVARTALLDDGPIDVLQLTTEALRLVPAEPATPLRARVLAVHARANSNRRRKDEALRWATQASELARALDLPAVLADATTTVARLNQHPDPEQAERALRTSIAQARAAGDPSTEMRSRHSLGGLLYERGHLDAAQVVYRQAAARAAELRRPWAPYGLDARAMAVIVTFTRGDWASAERLVDTAGQSPPPLARALLDAVGLAVSAGRGDRAAIDELPQLRPWWDRDGFIAVACASAAIDLHGDAGNLPAAVAVHDEAVAVVTPMWGQMDFQARIRLSALLLGQLASAAADAGTHDREALAGHGRHLHSAAKRSADAATGYGPESAAWLTRVEAEHLRLRWLTGDQVDPDGLVRAWAAAADAFEQFGHVFETARSRARLAAALRATGRPAEAQAQATQAIGIARALGAAPLLSELQARGRPPTPPGGPAPAQLTAREHEVLSLVAQGRSNREIGQVLFISAKTVSVHVSNILAKLGATGRVEAVAMARRRSLLGPD